MSCLLENRIVHLEVVTKLLSNRGWSIALLNPFTAAQFASLTTPVHRSLIEHYDESRAIAIGAFGPDGPLGLSLAVPERGTATILSVYVSRNFRGCGIGRELLLDVIEQARKIGYRSMHGDTLPAMTAALTMYEQLGFRRTPPYAEPPTPGAIYLELTL